MIRYMITPEIAIPKFMSLCKPAPNLFVIAIGDDYKFAFFGLVTKLWLKFQGPFY